MQNYKARQTALLGMLFALSMALSFLESMLTPFFGLMPAMKLGLSNIVVMYAVLFLNRRSALYLVLLKALFALLTRGVTAGFLSLCGGVLSLAVFCLLLALPFTITGYIFSVSGALAHNCGQLLGAAALLSDKMAITYAPMLLIAGLIVGSCTYMVSRLIFPAVKRNRYLSLRTGDFGCFILACSRMPDVESLTKPNQGAIDMAKKKILMLAGDFVEDYEIMVPYQMLLMVGHDVDVVSPGKKPGDVIAEIEAFDGTRTPVTTCIGGILRGLLRDGYPVTMGFKVADVDPRREELENCFLISDKARCIAGSVLELVAARLWEEADRLSLWESWREAPERASPARKSCCAQHDFWPLL